MTPMKFAQVRVGDHLETVEQIASDATALLVKLKGHHKMPYYGEIEKTIDRLRALATIGDKRMR